MTTPRAAADAVPSITDIRFTSVHAPETSAGLLGFVAATFQDLWRIDGIAVRRARDGRVVLSFPKRHDRQGRAHSIVHPVNDEAREVITRAVLSALGTDLAGPGAATTAPIAQADSAR